MAIAGAMFDSSAMLAITGNVPTSQFNRGRSRSPGSTSRVFPGVIRSYVKRSFQAVRPEMLPLMLSQAFVLMTSGRPGPVNIDVPLNVFVEDVGDEVATPLWRPDAVAAPTPSP
jgi:acetolactate synthase I/II/III large subunit